MKPTDNVTITITVEQLCIIQDALHRSKSAIFTDYPKGCTRNEYNVLEEVVKEKISDVFNSSKKDLENQK